jgi:hypothetical protein
MILLAAYPTPLPIFVPISVFQDDNGNLLDVLAVNSLTAILGKSGGGKAHLVCHLDHAVGTDQGVEPRVGCRHHASTGTNRPHSAHHATLSQPPRHPNPPCRSITRCSHTTTTNPHAADVGEQPAVLEAARLDTGLICRRLTQQGRQGEADGVGPTDRRRQPTLQRAFASADRRLCPVLLNGQLPTMDLLTSGRSMWLTVMSLHVPDPGAVGNVVRINKATVLFFKSTIYTVSEVVGTRGPGQGVEVGDAVRARHTGLE